MTNPRCKTCGGWGFTNKATPGGFFPNIRFDPPLMEFCVEPYPSGKMKGEPCTPRTTYMAAQPAAGKVSASSHTRAMLPSERRAAVRNASA